MNYYDICCGMGLKNTTISIINTLEEHSSRRLCWESEFYTYFNSLPLPKKVFCYYFVPGTNILKMDVNSMCYEHHGEEHLILLWGGGGGGGGVHVPYNTYVKCVR